MADVKNALAALTAKGIPLTNFNAANKALNMTPQEQAFYLRHLTNLWGNGGVTNPDGSRSSLLQLNIQGPDGRAYNVPTVWNGQELNPDNKAQYAQIMANVQGAGGLQAFPSYATWQQADDRYINGMHPFMDRDTANYLAIARPDGAPMYPTLTSAAPQNSNFVNALAAMTR
jgi:hypothetical protein